MIALISSAPEEGRLLCRHLLERSVIGEKSLYQGKIEGKDIAYIISGIGKTNAAHVATILIEKFSPELVILFGVGGAYSSAGLEVGDIAIAEKEIYGDEGVLAKDGFHGTEFIGIPLLKKGRKKYFNEFPLDKSLIKHLTRYSSLVTKSGTFITVSTCTGTRKRALELKKRYGAICENMEGAAVAHICAIYGAPMLEIRGISNIVEDRDKNKWDIRLAAENCQKAVMALFKEISYFL